jgi:indolepyruvate ferredoxin oxidoreductase
MVLMGAAWQQGGVPLSLASIHRAIALNGTKVEQNYQAFDLGRLAYADPVAAQRLAGGDAPVDLSARRAEPVDELIARRTDLLRAYGIAANVTRYTDRLTAARQAGCDDAALRALAKGHFKMLAVKDEWEVARLYADPAFKEGLKQTFDGDLKLTFHVGAWPFGKMDQASGRPIKGEVGPWVLKAFGVMSKLRGLRGTLLDPFRNSAEAKLARRLLADYEADVAFALENWSDDKSGDITALLNLPEQIRGYGHIRERQAEAAAVARAELRTKITAQPAQVA